MYMIILRGIVGFLVLMGEANDGIPDNCEHRYGAHYRPHLFPRYEPHNRRLLLVDWATGDEAMTLSTDLPDTRILGWSVDCRYLAVAVGSVESMDTVVWDTVDNLRIGAVPDAHQRPHVITWGPGSYLVVETRNGAILWNVPANTQVILTDSFDPATTRNFSRLRWDATHNQLIANFAVGGRTVYDLNTGQETVAAGQTDSVPKAQKQFGTIVIGGGQYPCQSGYRYGYRNWFVISGMVIPGIYPKFNPTTNSIYLVLEDHPEPGEVIQVIEADVNASWFQFRGWSASCRYFAASLGIPGQDASNTVVWDIIENRRVDVYPDARQIMHPIHWAEIDDTLVIETRDGAFLWHLPTNTHTLLTDHVQVALSGASGIASFDKMVWDQTRQELLAIPVNNPNAIQAYNATTGQQIALYELPDDERSFSDFEVSSDGNYLLMLTADAIVLWDRNTSAASVIKTDDHLRWSPEKRGVELAPNHQHLVASDSTVVVVWDLTNSIDVPLYKHDTSRFYPIRFVDNVTVVSPFTSSWQLNIVTGDIISLEAIASQAAQMDGTSGYSRSNWRNDLCDIEPNYDLVSRQLVLRDKTTLETFQVLDTDLNYTDQISLSPDCRYVMGEVHVVSNADVPYDDAPLDDIYRDYLSEDVVIWDVETGIRFAEFPNPYSWGRASNVFWSPDGVRAIVQTANGRFLLNLVTGESKLLTFASEYGGSIDSYPKSYWDYERGQVLVEGLGSVYAFDMQTGIERHKFEYIGSFSISDDNTYLFGGDGYWNLDTLENVRLDVDLPNRSFIGNRAALSPDERYLVMARNMIRVWDLHNLPEELDDRDPVYRHHGPDALIQSIRFVDEGIVETTSVLGIQHWNVVTGEEVGVE